MSQYDPWHKYTANVSKLLNFLDEHNMYADHSVANEVLEHPARFHALWEVCDMYEHPLADKEDKQYIDEFLKTRKDAEIICETYGLLSARQMVEYGEATRSPTLW